MLDVGAHLRTRGAAAALAGLLGIAVLAACGEPAGTNTGQPGTETTAEQGLGNTSGDTGNGGNPSGGATRTASPRPSTSRTPSQAPGPTIEFFKITQQPTCRPLSRPDLTSTPIKVSWKVTGGATAVRLYLNGGLYGDNYGVEHEQELYFACNTEHGAKTHKYEIKTVGGGAQRTATLSATAITPP